MKTIDFSYFIERYIADEMSASEQEWFRKELEGNDNLRDEVALRKRTDEILKNQDIISLRTKLSAIENLRKTKKPVKGAKKPSYIRYAAAIAILVLLGSIGLFTGRHLTNEQVMNRYYKAYEPVTNQRSAQSGSDADFSLAVEYYNTHDYNKAAELFSKVLEKKPNDMQTVLLVGVSNFEEKKYPEAKKSFGKVIDDKDNLYIDQAQWYLALCYMNTNETDKAKQLFNIIENEGGIYKNDARKILKGLK